MYSSICIRQYVFVNPVATLSCDFTTSTMAIEDLLRILIFAGLAYRLYLWLTGALRGPRCGPLLTTGAPSDPLAAVKREMVGVVGML